MTVVTINTELDLEHYVSETVAEAKLAFEVFRETQVS